MDIEIISAPLGLYCLHPHCKKIKEYVSPKGRIKQNTTVAKITIYFKSIRYPTRIVYYCRSCIDQVFFDCRLNLDPKFWVFK